MQITKFALVLSCLGTPAMAQELPEEPSEVQDARTEVTLLGGADYAAGDVDGRSYETVAVNAGLAVRSGRFSIAASIPYVVTSAPEELIVSNGGVLGTPLLAQSGSQIQEVTREGIGDLVLQGGYEIPLGSVNAFLGGNVKLPTASREQALGSGKTDYGVNGQLSRRFGDVIPFMGASYTVIGEPDGFDVENVFGGTAGSHIVLGRASSATISYSYEQSAERSFGDRQSLGLGFNTDLSSSLRLGLDARAGLTDNAPDARVGVRIGVGL